MEQRRRYNPPQAFKPGKSSSCPPVLLPCFLQTSRVWLCLFSPPLLSQRETQESLLQYWWVCFAGRLQGNSRAAQQWELRFLTLLKGQRLENEHPVTKNDRNYQRETLRVQLAPPGSQRVSLDGKNPKILGWFGLGRSLKISSFQPRNLWNLQVPTSQVPSTCSKPCLKTLQQFPSAALRADIFNKINNWCHRL